MMEREMQRIAELMKGVIVDGEEPGRVREDAMKLAEEFQGVEYCFR